MFARRGGFNGDNARRLLGFAPEVGLADGFRHPEAWLREIGELD